MIQLYPLYLLGVAIGPSLYVAQALLAHARAPLHDPARWLP